MPTKKVKTNAGQRKNIFIVSFGKYCCSLLFNNVINNCPFLSPTDEMKQLGCALWHTVLESDDKDSQNRPVRCPRCISVYK